MATRAAGNRSNTAWAMRPMARLASTCELAVCRLGLRRVTGGAAELGCRPSVRLMAVDAVLVALRGRRRFLGVARLAFFPGGAAVRLVTAEAGLMPGAYGLSLRCVTRAAGTCHHCWLMREPAVAALAGRVPLHGRGERELRVVAALAHLMLSELEFEAVWLVTTLTSDGAMKRALAGRCRMAATASARDQLLLPEGRMSIMTRHTGVPGHAFRMIGVHVTVTVGASPCRRSPHVMRRVAARAQRMRRHLGLGQHNHLIVARSTGPRALGFESVRLMAAHTLSVAAGKERARRHERRRLCVAVPARVERGRARCVLLRVASGAHRFGTLALHRVGGVNLGVAAHAIGRHWSSILVRPMAAHALAAGVHRDGSEPALRLRMAALAILGVKRIQDAAIARLAQRALRGEGMTAQALVWCRRLQQIFGSPRRMLNLPLCFVASRAARFRNCAHGIVLQLVAPVARNVVLHHVDAVTAHAPTTGPLAGHVNALPGCAADPLGTARGGAAHEHGQRQHEKSPDCRGRSRDVHL